MKKLLALLLALAMVLALAACGGPEPTPTEPPTSAPTNPPTTPPTAPPTEPPTEPPVEEVGYKTITPIEPDNDPYIVPKYTETTTADGWVLVENEGGDTLGYWPGSGVSIIQVEGFAFKDMDKDGKLDGYEDWRNTTEERAADLVSQMTIEEMAPLMAHGGWGSMVTTPIPEDNSTYAYIMGGARSGVTRNAGKGVDHAIWTNYVQALCEETPWSIPAFFSIDPMSISGLVETLSLASTMDTELAHEIGIATSKQYRALGVAALLGPQVDLASPIMQRASGTYGEDPRLTRDLAQAYVNAMQSTWSEDGEDLGWGAESVYCFTKHFAGAGASEGGRDDHRNPGRYAVFAGNNYEAHIIAYFDGVFNLPGKTGSAGVMPQYAINVDAEGNPYGGEWGGSFNPFNMGLLTENWTGMAVTDWGIISGPMATWYPDGMTAPQVIARIWEMGGQHLGLQSNLEEIAQAIPELQAVVGEERAEELLSNAAYQFITVLMNLELFDNPYNDTAYTAEVAMSDAAKAFGLETQKKSVVMLKNTDNFIKAAEEGAEKLTVYVPSKFTAGAQGRNGYTPASVKPAMDVELLGQYFNVVTDTTKDPSGKDPDGNPELTADDIVRADLTGVDFILVPMTAPFTASALTAGDDGLVTEVLPPSIQYGEYTASTARAESIGGKVTVNTEYDPYGAVISETSSKENRSYKDQTVGKSSSYADLELLQWVDSIAGDVPVVVSMTAARAMCWHEVEPLADVILVCYNNQRVQVVSEIILGQTEPTGLLVFQQPIDMLTVEAQNEDVPRDMTCYVDANGNTYDFAFGMNWSGVIADERVDTYTQAPLTDVENFDYDAYEAANHNP